MTYTIVVGARPNFIKLAAFMHEAKDHPEHDFHVIHTGQHYDDAMSQIFFRELGIPKPDVILEDGSLGKMVKDITENVKGYAVIVFGDTRSALAASLVNLEVVHIEAGLRSFDNRMPEETNRIVIDNLSSKLFVSEPSGMKNLADESDCEHGIYYVGNLMLETLDRFLPEISKAPKGDYIVATIHRVENSENLRSIMSLLSKIGKVKLVIHPGTAVKIREQGISLDGIEVLEPLGYIDFMKLVYGSKGVITDSGGIQEETSYLKIPCVTLRDNTERPSTLACSNKLFSVKNIDIEGIRAHLSRSDFTYTSDFPDNRVAKRIFEHL